MRIDVVQVVGGPDGGPDGIRPSLSGRGRRGLGPSGLSGPPRAADRGGDRGDGRAEARDLEVAGVAGPPWLGLWRIRPVALTSPV